jgi:hypothetical protein
MVNFMSAFFTITKSSQPQLRRYRKDRDNFIALANHSLPSSRLKHLWRQGITLVGNILPLILTRLDLRTWQWFLLTTGARDCDISHPRCFYTFFPLLLLQKALKKLSKESMTLTFSFHFKYWIDQEKWSCFPSWHLYTYDFPWHIRSVDSLIQIGPTVADMNVVDSAYTLYWKQSVLITLVYGSLVWAIYSTQQAK